VTRSGCQQDRVEIHHPKRNLQIKISKPLSSTSEFVAYVDALAMWTERAASLTEKTTAAREPESLLALDPQLACYSWLTGEP
jgi:hypothetical protein